MKRTPFRRRQRAEGPTAAREDKPWAQALATATLRPARAGTYAGGTAAAAPKPVEHRCPALLEMAKDRPCLLLVPAVCNHRTDTTVACHSNLSIHGKAAARKADDQHSCWGCAACHAWLDQGRADGVIKEMAFMQGHLLQVLAWRQIAVEAGEPERFRRAAAWALERLGATPVGEAP